MRPLEAGALLLPAGPGGLPLLPPRPSQRASAGATWPRAETATTPVAATSRATLKATSRGQENKSDNDDHDHGHGGRGPHPNGGHGHDAAEGQPRRP